MSTTNVLITGAGRGIGRGLLEFYLSLDNHVIIAAVRNVEHENAKSLKNMPTGAGTKLHMVRIDSGDASDPKRAMEILATELKIDHIDILIANAGICEHLVPIKEIEMDEMNSIMAINTWSLLYLYQAALPMLAGSLKPKLVYISSTLGSISLAASSAQWTGAYGLSKAAGNFLVQKIQAENDHLMTLSIHPGLVQTEMGNRGAQYSGLKEAPVTLAESVHGIVAQIQASESKNASRSLLCYDGSEEAW